MSKRNKLPVEKLDLAYSRKRQDIEDVFSDMFGPGAPKQTGNLLPVGEILNHLPQFREALDSPSPPVVTELSGVPEGRAVLQEEPLKSTQFCSDELAYTVVTLTPGAIKPPEGNAPMSEPTILAQRHYPSVIADTTDFAPLETPRDAAVENAIFSQPQERATAETKPERITPLGFRARVVQDAHTIWEQTLYDALWAMGAGESNGPKVVCAGYRTLAAKTRFGDKTIKRNLRSLEEKLAIEPIAPEETHTSTGRTYRIYSFRQILDRRRTAGLEWVIRNRQGVSLTSIPINFSTRASGTTQPPVVKVNAGVIVPPGGTQSPVSMLSPPPRATVSDDPVVRQTTHLVKSLEKNKDKPSSSESPLIIEALRDSIGVIDDDAARRISTKCRENVMDATDDEISYFIRIQAKRIIRMRGVDNPIGLLITQVPKCFQGESFRQFREAEEKQRQAEFRRREQWYQEARTIIENPNSSDADKEWAQLTLQNSL